MLFYFSSRRRHTRWPRDWSSDVCSSDLEAMVTVDQAPAGHDGRARYWAAYLDDRHAEMLAACGQETRALRAARRARDGWRHLGSPEDVTRLDQLIVRLETPSTR